MASNDKWPKPQESESWDTDGGMLHPPVEDPIAVVAVRFSSEEFQCVSRAARRSGMPTTQFIHAAALASASQQLPANTPVHTRSAPRLRVDDTGQVF